MGHTGDISARYSTNKVLPPDTVEAMRETYKKCEKYITTEIREPSENDAKRYLQTQLLLAVGYRQEEIEKMDLESMSNDDFQKLLRDKVMGAMTGNGSRQRAVPIEEVEQYLSKGYEFQSALPNGKAIMKLPF